MYAYNGILFSHKKDDVQIHITTYTDETWRHRTKQKKLNTKGRIYDYESSYVKCPQ